MNKIIPGSQRDLQEAKKKKMGKQDSNDNFEG